MITKEKLEQLLKEGVTIYEAKYGKIEHVDLSQAKEYLMSKEYIKLKDIKTHFLTRKRYNRLFETEEEAEWYLEFGNIQRTETLSLPSWEEVIKEVVYEKNIYGYDRKNYVLIIENYGNEPTIEIGCLNDYSGIFEAYDKPLTKENYTEACRLAKKLFLGENAND